MRREGARMPFTWSDCLPCVALLFGPALLVLGVSSPVVGSKRWTAFGCLMTLGLSALVAESAYRQLGQRWQPPNYRAHYVLRGGQVAMWGNWHVEIARDVAGEYRLWVADAYRRPISAAFYQGRVIPDPSGEAVELERSLDQSYAFARLPRNLKVVRLELELPGRQLKFRYSFEGPRRSTPLPEWCAPTTASSGND